MKELDPCDLTGDLGIQKTGDQTFIDGNLLISMDGYRIYYNNFLNDPSDYRNSIQLAMRQPGIQMVWNYRRLGMIQGKLDPKNELAWVRFLLTAHPKSCNIWSQLFWILKFFSKDLDLDNIEFLDQMMVSGSKILGNYSYVSNFLISRFWVFRLKYTLWQVEERKFRGLDCHDWIKKEIYQLKKWCRLHPNDHSGLSFLFTLSRMDSDTDWNEYQEWLRTLMELYPDRPGLKMHKKEVFCFIQESSKSSIQ